MKQTFKELHSFITRRKVIELYRDCLRESRKLPKSARGDLLAYTRDQFETNRKESNISIIRHLIASGREELEHYIRTVERASNRIQRDKPVVEPYYPWRINSNTVDKSKKGSVDEPIKELIKIINFSEDLVTTSSCSGRIMLISKYSSKLKMKKGGEWIYTTHEIPKIDEILNIIQNKIENINELELSFDPFILAVDCRDIDIANKLVMIGRNNGFRESGIVFGKEDKIHVTIRSNNRFQIPLTQDLILNNEEYIKYILNMMIDKFKINQERLNKFKEDFILSNISNTVIQNNEITTDLDYELNWQKSLINLKENSDLLKRWGHSSTAHLIENEKIVIFGGYGGSNSHQRLNDIIILNLNTNEIIQPRNDNDNAVAPEPMMGHTLNIIDDKIIIIGGRRRPNEILNEIYILNNNTWEWECRKYNEFPCRYRHTAVTYLNKIIIYGGKSKDDKILSDLWILDINNDKLDEIKIINNDNGRPGARMSHASCIWNNALYISGGFKDYGIIYDDIYKLELNEMKEWEFIKKIKKTFSHILIPIDDLGIMIYGGCPDMSPNLLYVFNPISKIFRILKTGDVDPLKLIPLRSSGIIYNDKLFIIGGGAFCFSFGSIFNEIHYIDINKIKDVFNRPKLQNCEFKCSKLCLNEVVVSDALIVDKNKGKYIKEILKNSNNLNLKLKARMVESETKIAFPIKNEKIEITTDKITDDTLYYIQKLEFECLQSKLSPVENLRNKLIQMLNNSEIIKKDTDILISRCKLINEIPTKWEMIGDIALIPENTLKSKEWSQLNNVYKITAEIIGASRLARQHKIENNCKRESRAKMLYGKKGNVRHVESGIIYNFDVTECMFSSGNITERIRMSKLDCNDEVVLDLFAGIGYFTLPILIKTNAKKVYACDWNKNAIKALKQNLIENKVNEKCIILEGDCREMAPENLADRVILGLLPSSEIGWKTALKGLKSTGGWLHLHQNIKDNEEGYINEILNKLKKYIIELNRNWEIKIKHKERVKWYGPHIRHIVLDIYCQNEIKIYNNINKEIFNTKISPERKPIIIKSMDIGTCLTKWQDNTYLINHEDCKDLLVGVHVCGRSDGLMDFIDKNYEFHTMPFSELIERCNVKEVKLNSIINENEHYYLRTIGKNARKETSNLNKLFPKLSEDIKIPNLFEKDLLFSSVLRVSTAKLRLWTHFDIMDNFLIQIVGTKKIRLWSPDEEENLYIKGSSSMIIDILNVNDEKYPKFKLAKYIDIELRPGDILFIPALWFHNIYTETFSISINVFFKDLSLLSEFYDKKDLYGNRDLLCVKEADELIMKINDKMKNLPDYYKKFYSKRLIQKLNLPTVV